MNNKFWNLIANNSNRTAIITENHDVISYQQLEKDVIEFEERLPTIRSLVFLSVSNDYISIVAYLACLRKAHPFLIIDSELDESIKQPLFRQYCPNIHVNSGKIDYFHENEYELNENLALLMSTSGTTGAPKLVRLSGKNLSTNVVSIVDYLNILPSDVAITSLPMSYSYGLSVINTHLASGACVVLNSDGIVTREFWNKVEKYKVSTLSGVPFTFQMLRKLNYKRFNTKSIRYLTQAGGKLDENTLKYFHSVCSDLCQKFFVMYGQTEASPRISYVPAESLVQKLGSIGIPIPGGALKIYDNNLPVLTPFTVGEIVYFGENVMMGYAESIEDLAFDDTQSNVLRTGDLGYFDEDGYFYITGRAKRFIKLFGLRISLDEIDNWFSAKGIEAVSAGNDDLLVVFYTESDLDIDSLKSLLADKFKLNLNFICFRQIESIPRKNGGKVDFKQLSRFIEKNS